MSASRIPIVMLLHPVGVGATRAMNVLSTKLWLRALVDLLPDVVISAPWLPYAEAMISRERGIRDAIAMIDLHDGGVAVGGEFSLGMSVEWARFGEVGRARIDLTRQPMPAILTYETFSETQTPAFRQAVTRAFQVVTTRREVA